VVRIKMQMKKLRVPEIEADENSAVVSFDESSRVNFDRLIEMVKDNPEQYRFGKDQSVIFSVSEGDRLFEELENFLKAVKHESQN
jgi:transcription-repair coupling factor (superfamily II helicase)